MPAREPAADVEVRPATPDDLADVLRILRDNPISAAREGDQGIEGAGYADALAEILADERQLLLVGVRAGMVVATCTVRFFRTLTGGGGRVAQVESMHAAGRIRGQGVGTTLMTWVIAEARRRGCFRVELTSDTRRTDAHRFYAAFGFTATHVGMKLAL